MPRRALIQFALLAAFWGASYLFIKVALEDGVGPLPIVFARTALAALVLLPLALSGGHLRGIRAQPDRSSCSRSCRSRRRSR